MTSTLGNPVKFLSSYFSYQIWLFSWEEFNLQSSFAPAQGLLWPGLFCLRLQNGIDPVAIIRVGISHLGSNLNQRTTTILEQGASLEIQRYKWFILYVNAKVCEPNTIASERAEDSGNWGEELMESPSLYPFPRWTWLLYVTSTLFPPCHMVEFCHFQLCHYVGRKSLHAQTGNPLGTPLKAELSTQSCHSKFSLCGKCGQGGLLTCHSFRTPNTFENSECIMNSYLQLLRAFYSHLVQF